MDTKAKRGRPAKPDAKVAVSLRLRPGLVEAYQASGPDWRVRMEAALEAGLAPSKPEQITKPLKAKPAAVEAPANPPKRTFQSRLKGEWKAP